jgi:hypothetical protein
MTAVVGILFAVIAGSLVSRRRRMAAVMVVPFLAVLAVQTWGIASGHATSPPSTVQYPGLYSYYFVQILILAVALGAANQLRIRRLRRNRSLFPDKGIQSETRIALAASAVVSALVVLGFGLASGIFDSAKAQHAASGSPPIVGLLGMLLSIAVLIGFGAQNLKVGRTTRSLAPSADDLEPVSQITR